MKTMKKLFCTLLAVVMLLAMAGVAMAEDTTTTTTTTTVPPVPTGTITIEKLQIGEDVKVYQVIEFESKGEGALDDAKWVSAIQSWIDRNSPTYDEYKDAADLPDETAKTKVSASEFYNALAGQLTGQADDETTATSDEFTTKPLPVGSYVVLVMGGEKAHQAYLTSIKPLGYSGTTWSVQNGTVDASTKTSTPKVEKKADKTTVAYGDKVTFNVESDVPTYPASAYNVTYMLEDTLDKGLTYNGDLVVYGDDTPLVEGTHFRATYSDVPDSNGKIKIFSLSFDYAQIRNYKKIKLVYTATVNENIHIGSADNTNRIDFTYDHNHKDSETVVYAFGFDLTKYADTQDNDHLLEGAEFELSQNSQALKFKKLSDGRYVVDPTGDTKLVTDANGKIIIIGLPVGDYKLNETKAPNGYNRMTEPKDVHIKQSTGETKYILDNTNDPNNGDSAYWYETIVDKKISGLPATGGMGTTIFMVAGIAVMACAVAALLVVLKRQKHSEG